jgi:hypothetical protein
MKLPYTEHDMVFKEPDAMRLVDQYLATGFVLNEPTLKGRILEAIEQARRGAAPVEMNGPDITLGWDEAFEAHYLVIHGAYDPENLVAMLYDHLVRFEEDELETDLAAAIDLIGRYVGTIEAKEHVDLSETRANLIDLTTKMKQTVHLFLEDQYSEDDIDHLSSALDRAYYEPLTEALEGMLVIIAGNKSSRLPGY